MRKKPTQPEEQAVDSVLRDFGVKPSEETRENLKIEIERQRIRFLTIDRVREKNQGRDVSR